MVEDYQAESEGWYKQPRIPHGHVPRTIDGRGSLFVQGAVDTRTDCDAEAEKEGVDHRIYHANGAGNDILGLKFECSTYCREGGAGEAKMVRWARFVRGKWMNYLQTM